MLGLRSSLCVIWGSLFVGGWPCVVLGLQTPVVRWAVGGSVGVVLGHSGCPSAVRGIPGHSCRPWGVGIGLGHVGRPWGVRVHPGCSAHPWSCHIVLGPFRSSLDVCIILACSRVLGVFAGP